MKKTCIWLLALWMGMGTVALAQDGSAADRDGEETGRETGQGL